jgi:hypothetical protein
MATAIIMDITTTNTMATHHQHGGYRYPVYAPYRASYPRVVPYGAVYAAQWRLHSAAAIRALPGLLSQRSKSGLITANQKAATKCRSASQEMRKSGRTLSVSPDNRPPRECRRAALRLSSPAATGSTSARSCD